MRSLASGVDCMIISSQDLNLATELNPLHERNHFRKGVALFELEEYESAKNSFEQSISLCESQERDPAVSQRWLRKCDVEIRGMMDTVLRSARL